MPTDDKAVTADDDTSLDDGADDQTTTQDTTAGKGDASGKGAETTGDKTIAEGGEKTAAAGDVKGGKTKTIAGGDDVEADDKAAQDAKDKAHKPYWPEVWRQKAAEHLAAGDKKVLAKELKRLERITDPAALAGMYRELEAKFSAGGLIKVPGKDAKPEEIAAYHKAIGVPEKPEEYFQHVKLENGAVIGEADKPLVDEFAAALHKAGAPPSIMNAALNWYYQRQESQAAALDESDDTFRRESETTLKEEFGPAFKRKTSAIASLFLTAPGGADIKNESALYARLMGGRTADGKIIGNDPDMVRFLVSLVNEVNPAATVVEDGAQSGKTIETELADIQKLRQTDSKKYWSAPVQARELELIEARNKLQARSRA